MGALQRQPKGQRAQGPEDEWEAPALPTEGKEQCSDGIITGIDQEAGRSIGISQALGDTEINE